MTVDGERREVTACGTAREAPRTPLHLSLSRRAQIVSCSSSSVSWCWFLDRLSRLTLPRGMTRIIGVFSDRVRRGVDHVLLLAAWQPVPTTDTRGHRHGRRTCSFATRGSICHVLRPRDEWLTLLTGFGRITLGVFSSALSPHRHDDHVSPASRHKRSSSSEEASRLQDRPVRT